MKGHTLMQAIARANRVYPGKTSGIIVDYVNVFKYMQQALTDYATGDDGDEFPAKDIEYLLELIGQSINEADEFLLDLDINLDEINKLPGDLEKLEALRNALEIIYQKDEGKEKFRVITNTMLNLYEASKPEIFEMGWQNEKFKPLKYLNDLMNNNVDDEKLDRAKARMQALLDTSVSSEKPEDTSDPNGKKSSNYLIHEFKVIDLSKVDVEELRKEIHKAQYKAIEIDDMKEFIQKMLQIMINKNTTRISFSERFKNIIDQYNAGGSENEDYYEQLLKLIEDMKNEDKRAETEGLTEEELESMADRLIEEAAGADIADQQETELWNLLSKLDPDSYPEDYDPYNDPDSDVRMSSEPSRDLILTVRTEAGEKTIACRGICIGGAGLRGYDDRAQTFLEVCEGVTRLLEQTPEWQSLPDYEFYYE
jgi:type I restriction enzyme R subunit